MKRKRKIAAWCVMDLKNDVIIYGWESPGRKKLLNYHQLINAWTTFWLIWFPWNCLSIICKMHIIYMYTLGNQHPRFLMRHALPRKDFTWLQFTHFSISSRVKMIFLFEELRHRFSCHFAAGFVYHNSVEKSVKIVLKYTKLCLSRSLNGS
jgi:hypothetical protein